jgi:hypothetical protein
MAGETLSDLWMRQLLCDAVKRFNAERISSLVDCPGSRSSHAPKRWKGCSVAPLAVDH